MKIEKSYSEKIVDDNGHLLNKGDTIIYSRADGEDHIGKFDGLHKGLIFIKPVSGEGNYTLRPKNIKAMRKIRPIAEIDTD